MKVVIKDDSNKQIEIDAGSVLVNGRSLASIVSEVTLLTKSFNMYKSRQEEKEKELHKLWGKVKNAKP